MGRSLWFCIINTVQLRWTDVDLICIVSTQKIMKPEVHYRCHKSSPLVFVVSRSIQSTALKLSIGDPFEYYPPIYACIFLEVYFSQVSPPKSCIHLSTPPYLPHAPPIFFSWFNHPNDIWCGVKVMKLLDVRSSPFLCETKNYSFKLTQAVTHLTYSGGARFESPFRHRQFRCFPHFYRADAVILPDARLLRISSTLIRHLVTDVSTLPCASLNASSATQQRENKQRNKQRVK
jgi:hypothetical protein